MTIQQDNNGAEAASHPSKVPGAHDKIANNRSHQQSLYIAAISKYLGYDGLISPMSDTREGVRYTFDFFAPKQKRLFKIFHEFDEETYRLYSGHPFHPNLIYDLPEDLCRQSRCRCGRCDLMDVDDEIHRHLCDDPFSRICQDGRIWECFNTWNGGHQWREALPIALVGVIEEDGIWDDGDEMGRQ